MSFVYFVSSPAMKAVKIGYSASDPLKRLKALQTGNADDLIMLGWQRGTVADEQKWQRTFADYWIRGEWFRLDGEFADFIRAFLDHYWSRRSELGL